MHRWGGTDGINENEEFTQENTQPQIIISSKDGNYNLAEMNKNKDKVMPIIDKPDHATILDNPEDFTIRFIHSFSPRSKEAMRQFGAVPKDIAYKDHHSFVLELEKDTPEEIADIRFHHDQAVKLDFIKKCRRKRGQLVKQRWVPKIQTTTRKVLTRTSSTGNILTNRSCISNFDNCDNRIIQKLDNEEYMKERNREQREKTEIANLFLGELRRLKLQNKKLEGINHLNHVAHKRKAILNNTARQIKNNQETKRKRVKINKEEKDRLRQEEEFRRENEIRQRELKIARIQKEMREEETRNISTRKGILHQFEAQLKSIESCEGSRRDKHEQLKKLEFSLKKTNKNTRNTIETLENDIKKEKELVRRKMLAEQLVKWKEFIKRQEWMHKKFNQGIIEEQQREHMKRTILQKDEDVKLILEKERLRRTQWSREMEAMRREKAQSSLRKLKREQAKKNEDLRKKMVQRQKEIDQMKKMRAKAQKCAGKMRDEKRKEAQLKALKEAKERETRIQAKAAEMERGQKLRGMKEQRQLMIEKEKRKLKNQEKFLRIQQLQRQEKYKKDQLISNNESKMQRSQLMEEYKRYQVVQRKEKHVVHIKKKDTILDEFNKFRRSDMAQSAGNDSIIHIIRLAQAHLDDTSSFMKHLESNGFSIEDMEEIIDQKRPKKSMKRSKSAGRLGR